MPFGLLGWMAMPPGDALLAAVLATPDDDAPRRGLADWLVRRKNPRGRFIQVQLELARGGSPPSRRRALRARERSLLAAHGARWCAPFDPAEVTFHRGFVESITCEGEVLLERDGDRVLEREPVRSLSVFGYFPCAHHRFLSRVASLDISANAGGADCITGLVALPYLTSLVHLDVSASLVHGESDWVERVTASPHLPRLTSVELGYNDVFPRGASALARSALLSRLIRLGLPYARVGDEGVEALAASDRVERLAALDLRGNQIGRRGARALARAPWLGGLTTLDLRDNDIDDEAAAALRARLPAVLLGEGAVASDETDPVWRYLDGAWARAAPELDGARARLATRDPDAPPPRMLRIFKALPRVTRVLQFFLERLERPERLALDDAIRALWADLDHDALWEVIGGSDDGFISHRCFIVVMGRRYYEAVSARHELGIPGADCEDLLGVVPWACEARGEEYP